MKKDKAAFITVAASIHAPVEKVWKLWTDPAHIIRWSHPSADWHTTKAENDLREGGKFYSRMEAKDGSTGFDFTGKYTRIEPDQLIEYTIDDGRTVLIMFDQNGNGTKVSETFEAEQTNSEEFQKTGWQAIMDNFKDYAEKLLKMKKLRFQIEIKASPEKVYKTMIDEKGYNEWTSVFNATSHYEGSWEKGSNILFLGTDQDGKSGGMASRIRENIPDKFISIEHLGSIEGGNEITNTPETDIWTGALENYTFIKSKGGTLLTIDTDSVEQFISYFETMWPKALTRLKEICEK